MGRYRVNPLAGYNDDEIEMAKTAAYEIAGEAFDLMKIPVPLRNSLLRPVLTKMTMAVLNCSDSEMRATLYWIESQIPTPTRARGNMFKVGDKFHWTRGWQHHFTPTAHDWLTPDADILTGLEAAMSRALVRAEQNSMSTAATTKAITNTLVAWARKAGYTAIKELSIPVVPIGGTAYGRVDLIVFRPGQPELVIEIDSANTARSVPKLEFARDAGTVSIWIRWKAGGLLPVEGVHTIDARIKTQTARAA